MLHETNNSCGGYPGCYNELLPLLDKTGLRPEDLLISVGDLVDRGNMSREVWQYFMTRPNTITLMGNHERKHLQGVLNYAQEIVKVQMGDEYPHFLAWAMTAHLDLFAIAHHEQLHRYPFKTLLYKSRSGNLRVEDLRKSLNTPAKIKQLQHLLTDSLLVGAAKYTINQCPVMSVTTPTFPKIGCILIVDTLGIPVRRLEYFVPYDLPFVDKHPKLFAGQFPDK